MGGAAEVGTIARRTGNPPDTDPWEWLCGFYPGCEPREHQNGMSATFDQARTDFEAAWAILLPKRTEANFEAWRRQKAWTVWKYSMQEAGCRMPAQNTSGQSRCFCGATIDLKNTTQHVHAGHMTGPRVRMRYVTNRPFEAPEAAARKLLEIVVERYGRRPIHLHRF